MNKGIPTLVADAGNWGDDKGYAPGEKSRFIFERMARMGYDVATPGSAELTLGPEALRTLVAAQSGVGVVSANLKDGSGRPVFPESVVIDKGGIRFGVTGTTGAAHCNPGPRQGLRSGEEFACEDSKSALQRVIPRLRRECDIVVVLMHESPDEARRLIDAVPGMDVVIVGHDPGYRSAPDRVGQTAVVYPGNRGQYVYRLDLILDRGGKVVEFTGEGKPLGNTVAKDPEFDRIVTEWERDFQARRNADARGKASPSPR